MRLMAIVVSCGLLLVGQAGCGEDDETITSSASLKSRLLPVEQLPGFRVVKSLDWSDPFNLIVEGFFLPQSTRPADAVSVVTDNGFEGAFGQILQRGSGPEHEEARLGVVKLDSPAAAKKLRDWMHGQNLRQPCLAECIFSPRAAALEGVPESRLVEQVPNPPPGAPKPPEGEGPPTRYLAEFTVGRYLYFAWMDSGADAESKVMAGFKAYYEHVRSQTDA